MRSAPASRLGASRRLPSEHVELANGRTSGGTARYEATVEVVQYLGDEQLAYLRLGESEVVAKLPLEPQLEIGLRQKFLVPLQKIHLFDAESGAAMGSAA